MTPDDARAFCDDLQERVTQMGERTGEGLHLGRCLSVIRSQAATLDDPAALNARIEEIAAQREAERMAAEDAAAVAAAAAEAAADVPVAPTKKTKKTKATDDPLRLDQ